MNSEIHTLEIHNSSVTIYSESNSSPVKTLKLNGVVKTQPFVRWAGGKRWLAVASRELMPPNWSGHYYESFLGGGSFFFALSPKKATVSDVNDELVATYKAVRNDPDKVIELLKTYPYEKDFYYSLRAETPTEDTEIAARFIYLNHTCWNGLYRVNSKGKFNTPFGRHKNPTICDEKRLKRASQALNNINVEGGHFSEFLSDAVSGDWAYIDPPYITGHLNNGFLAYNQSLFSWNDQLELAVCVNKLSRNGVYILVSNADYPAVTDLYKGFYHYKTIRRSVIGRNLSSRGNVTEALLSNYPLFGVETKIIN